MFNYEQRTQFICFTRRIIVRRAISSYQIFYIVYIIFTYINKIFFQYIHTANNFLFFNIVNRVCLQLCFQFIVFFFGFLFALFAF